MESSKVNLFPTLSRTMRQASALSISEDRKIELQILIDYIQDKVYANSELSLNFICTHNSRRSQFSQIWAQTAADFYGVPANCFSGGVEITEFNERAVESIKRSGFRVDSKGSTNPVYFIFHSDEAAPIVAFSKLFDDPVNSAKNFAAVMTCAHADENCPFIPGTEKRIAVRYEDPKMFDGTAEEAAKYDERSLQIASEMFFVFDQIRS